MKKSFIYQDEALKLIDAIIEKEGSRSAAASALGISPQYLSDIMTGARAIFDNVAKRLGYSKIVVHEKQDWDVNND